jgi:putative addiction module component (TIGR02574 family)
MTAQELKLVDMVDSLPLDMKLKLLDRLVESISPTEKEIEEAWKVEAERRIDEVRSGRVKPIPVEEVFAEIERDFGK